MTPRYNVAPGSMMPVVIRKENTVAEVMRWGLVPFWAKDPRMGYKMINARAESLMEKPTWKKPFLESRCLIPASGVYEWPHQNGKQPYYITVRDQPLIAFAGLSSTWLDAENHPLKTFAIITTMANELVGKIHDRMPVIFNESEESIWLDPENKNGDDLQELLKPYESSEMTMEEA
jgi:putative SOS response-associated peptidase YedK